MLDVHPPQHTPHTWKDFFIHIATIVIGLLIAIGLEQTVEHFHHRHEVTETREALAHERAVNRKAFRENTAAFYEVLATVRNNLTVLEYLQQHPKTPEEKLPGIVTCLDDSYVIPAESAWKAAQQSGVIEFMPSREVQGYALLYNFLDLSNNQQVEISNTLVDSCRDTIADPDLTHLTPAQLAETVDRLKAVQVKILDWAPTLVNTGYEWKDFTGGPTEDDFNRLFSTRTPEKQQQLKTATELTDQRIRAAGPEPNSVQ